MTREYKEMELYLEENPFASLREYLDRHKSLVKQASDKHLEVIRKRDEYFHSLEGKFFKLRMDKYMTIFVMIDIKIDCVADLNNKKLILYRVYTDKDASSVSIEYDYLSSTWFNCPFEEYQEVGIKCTEITKEEYDSIKGEFMELKEEIKKLKNKIDD